MRIGGGHHTQATQLPRNETRADAESAVAGRRITPAPSRPRIEPRCENLLEPEPFPAIHGTGLSDVLIEPPREVENRNEQLRPLVVGDFYRRPVEVGLEKGHPVVRAAFP